MEKRIELENRGRTPDQIHELILDNCRSTTIEGLTDKYVNLSVLSLNNVGLTTLKGFPSLPNLQKLELSDNRISNGLNLLKNCPKLTHLNLSGNRIKDMETLEPLKDFTQLKNLDLFNNEVTKVENYKELTFKLIPSLKNLDGFDEHDQEVDESEGDSVNGNNEAEDEEEEGGENEEEEKSEEDSESGNEEDEVRLADVYKDNLDEESEGEDFDAGEHSEEDDDEDIDEEEESFNQDSSLNDSGSRGKKRKHDEEDGEAE